MNCCQCECKLNVVILVLSSTALFIQVLLLALKDFEQSIALQVVIAILNASLAFIQSLQIGLKSQTRKEDTTEKDVEQSDVSPARYAAMVERSLHKSTLEEQHQIDAIGSKDPYLYEPSNNDGKQV